MGVRIYSADYGTDNVPPTAVGAGVASTETPSAAAGCGIAFGLYAAPKA
jgi:hypothetical protein